MLEGEVVQLCKLDGLHFGIHIYKIFTQNCNHFILLEGSLIRWPNDQSVHLSGARLDVKLKEIIPKVEVNMLSAMEDPLP